MLKLLAPNFSEIDSIWRNPLPFALWPVGPQSLLAHWMDEAVRLGLNQVKIYASDRPAEIRRHLEGGAYWSCAVEVIPLKDDALAPADAVRVEQLPRQAAEGAAPLSPEALLRHWLAMQSEWLRGRESGAAHVDVERSPGGWTGPRVRVHPGANLIAPYWIGANAQIGQGCEIGPHAFIGANCVLDGQVQVCQSVAMPGTYLGPNLRVFQAIAQEGLLVDVRRGCRSEVRENFILSSVAEPGPGPTLAARAAAFAAWLLLAPLARFWPGQSWNEARISNGEGKEMVLKTGAAGPLIVRRWPWLKQIAAGRFCWFGILPRQEADWEKMPGETAQLLRNKPCGLFSWADLEGCHHAGAPDEWIHAAYQVTHQENAAQRMLRRHLLQLALRTL